MTQEVQVEGIDELGIEFARVGERRLLLDMLRPAEAPPGPVPFVIHLHGGGWFSGERSTMFNQPLTQAGMVTCSIDYRLTGEAPFPAQIHDTKAAIRWARAHASELGIDPDRIGIWGHSAGAHLAVLAALTADDPALEGEVGVTGVSSAVRAVATACARTELLIDWYAAGQLQRPEEIAHSIPALLGGPLTERQEIARIASPFWHLAPDAPPHLMIHGEEDDLVPINQARAFAARSRSFGNTCDLIAVPGLGHDTATSMLPGEDDPHGLSNAVVAFFQRHLGP